MLIYENETSRSKLFENSCHRAWLEIDHHALTNNVTQFKKILSPHTSLMGVIKADAYGHGAVKVAPTILQAGCSGFAIATLSEGVELRQAGITAPILILGAINTPAEVGCLAQWQLQATICNQQQALVFSETLVKYGQIMPVHLQLDTGMSRNGTLWEQATQFVTFVQQLPYLKIASIYSHFATADDLDPTFMKLQNQRFQKAIADLKVKGICPSCLHIANSAATLTDSNLHYNLVRVGLGLYGLYPASHLRSVISLRPALQLKARVTQVKTIPPNTGVSYGHQFISNKETRIAVVGIGYADGVPRNLSNQLQALVRGQRVPQIGAITMDQLMLDVTNIPDIQPTEIITLIGKDGDQQISAEDWASSLGTISWEILCGFNPRLPRIHIY